MIKIKTYNHDGSMNLDNCISAPQGDKMSPTMKLVEFVEVWLDVFKLNSVKASSYDRLITSFDALKKYAISEKPICEITLIDIQRYLNELVRNGYSLSSIKKQLRIVTAPLKYAASLRVIQGDPSVGIKLPSRSNIQKDERDVVAYDREDQGKLISVINHSDLPAFLCCEFMIETGARAGEALALTWKDIDFKKKKLSIHSTVVNLANKKRSYVQDSAKSYSSTRAVPLTPKAIELLEKLKENSTCKWVFESKGDRLSYESLRYRTRQLCELADVEYHGEHVFRHTFATNCYYRGVDIKVLSRLLGHADTHTTYNTYINLYGDGFETLYAALIG